MNDVLLYTYPQKDGKYRLKKTFAVSGMKVMPHLYYRLELKSCSGLLMLCWFMSHIQQEEREDGPAIRGFPCLLQQIDRRKNNIKQTYKRSAIRLRLSMTAIIVQQAA